MTKTDSFKEFRDLAKEASKPVKFTNKKDLDFDTEKLREIINKIDDFLNNAKRAFFDNQTTITKALIATKLQLISIKNYLNRIDF